MLPELLPSAYSTSPLSIDKLLNLVLISYLVPIREEQLPHSLAYFARQDLISTSNGGTVACSGGGSGYQLC